MMVLTIIGISLFVYIAISFLLYQIMNTLYKKGLAHVLRTPSKKIYYLLQFTWGLPMNIIGLIVATFLYATKHKPKKHGWSYWFELPIDFGLELGVFFLAPKNASTHTKNHEFGHGIQNIYLGPFTVGAVSTPSAIRFWVRRAKQKRGKQLTTKYDDIWFEGQATRSGNYFMQKKREDE